MSARISRVALAAIVSSGLTAVAGESVSGAGGAAGPTSAPPASAGTPAAAGVPGAGGLVVFVDPVTGKIRQPDAAEIGRLLAVKRAKEPLVSAPLLMKTGPGGAVGIVLDSRYESYIVMTKAPDGTLVTSCVTGKEKAEETVAGSAAPAAAAAGKESPGARR